MKGVTGKEWILLSHSVEPPEELVKRYGRFLAQLIANRGFEREADSLFELKLKYIVSYERLPNIDRGVERLLRAVRNRERIVLFGDYDVDGITGTAILCEVLKRAGARVLPVLPNRANGYGLNREIISVFSKYADLLVTIDNGTSAVEEIDVADIDVIVVDHHNVPEKVPHKAILINPRLNGSVPSELQELSSSAMSFYLAVLLSRELGLDMDVRELLDLVALGTVGDVMPMNRTNRILVSKGLSVMEGVLAGTFQKPGLRALLQVARLREKVSVKDIAYTLAPRLNAPGRISNPRLSLALLLEKDPQRAISLAKKIETLNIKRRRITERVYREANEKLRNSKPTNFLSLWDSKWHVGVLGIVAGRLARETGKPVAVFSEGKNHSVGSVRSIEGVDVYEGLSRISDMFLKWGGHSQAAGLTLETNKLENFSRKVDELFAHLPKKMPPLYIDMELSVSSVDDSVLEAVKSLEPYGERNPIPVFLSEELTINSMGVRYGRAKLSVDGREMFCWDQRLFEYLRPGSRVRLAYSLVDSVLYVVDVEERHGTR